MSDSNGSSLTRKFGDLKVRPKLMVLHNLFFLVLSAAVYSALIPLFDEQVATTNGDYASEVMRARITLFVVLGIVYVLAVILLEALIMPTYVYGPLTKMLEADQATQAGDREREMIRGSDIMDDEIGQIMRSRNDTIATLRRQEDELATALRRLEEQDRLVSLGLLSASVAHEMNTPLAVLHGSLEKIIETTAEPATLERLQRMQRVTHRLRTISESLVDFARVRPQSTEPVAVRAVVEEAWGLVALDAKAAGVTYMNGVAEETVNANAGKLVQVFVNLLRNAVIAVEGPVGRVEVAARAQERSGRKGVVITVDDNGPGIPKEVLPNVFDAFVTSRLDARGTGLGLTIAEGIVTQFGGMIGASNRKEGGARLEVWLPA